MKGEGGQRPGEVGRGAKKIKFAKTLRKNQTFYENKLWNYLRAKRIHNLKFRRQHPIGPFIVDFYCAKQKLVVELDAGIHTNYRQSDYDKKRDLYLNNRGLKVLRFWNGALFDDFNAVIQEILDNCVFEVAIDK